MAVIEDEALVLAGYSMLFESWGYQVVAGGSSRELLAVMAKARAVAPDIIVADFRLKDGEDGIHAVQTLEASFHCRIPAILITGDTGADKLRAASASGLPLLHKPVKGAQLRQLLEACLDRGPA